MGKPKKTSKSKSKLLRSEAGVLARAKLNFVGVALFMLVFAGLGVSVYQASFAATESEPEIESGIPGQCLDNYGDTAALNDIVDIYTCNGTKAQRWSIVGGNTVQVHGLCMQPYNYGTSAGTPIVTTTCSTDRSNFWTIAGNTMVNQASSLCLDDPSAAGTNGTQLVLATCNQSVAQFWTSATWYSATPTPPPPVGAPASSAPTPTPAQATPQSHQATPVPARPTTSTPATHNSTNANTPSPVPSAPAGSKQPPDAPGNFSARVSGTNAVVELSWTDPSDSSGIAGYEVDRSTDESNWTTLVTSLNADGYEDSSVSFSAHYFYRIVATDKAGLKSPYANTDVSTPPFQSNASQSSNSTYTSDDGLATVNIPVGALIASADCSLNMSSGNEIIPFGKSLAIGPYTIVCKNAAGTVISSFLKPLQWTLNLKGKLAHLSAPSIDVATSKGRLTTLSGTKFNAQTGAVTFQTSTDQAVLALAAATPDITLNEVAFILLAIAVMGGTSFIIINTKRKQRFNDYLRSKYTKSRS